MYRIANNSDPYFELTVDKRLLSKREEYIKSLEQQLIEKDKEIEKLKRYLQLEWAFTPVRQDGKTFTKLNVIQDFKNLIRKQICDEIREKAEYKNWSKAVPFVYVIKPEFLDQIEKGEV